MWLESSSAQWKERRHGHLRRTIWTYSEPLSGSSLKDRSGSRTTGHSQPRSNRRNCPFQNRCHMEDCHGHHRHLHLRLLPSSRTRSLLRSQSSRTPTSIESESTCPRTFSRIRLPHSGRKHRSRIQLPHSSWKRRSGSHGRLRPCGKSHRCRWIRQALGAEMVRSRMPLPILLSHLRLLQGSRTFIHQHRQAHPIGAEASHRRDNHR